MTWLLCTARDLDDLARLNACHDDRQIVAVPSDDGAMLVSSAIVGDEYWSAYQMWLTSLQNSEKLPSCIVH